MEPSEIKLTKTDVDHATALALDGEGNERSALAVCQTATRHERARVVGIIDPTVSKLHMFSGAHPEFAPLMDAVAKMFDGLRTHILSGRQEGDNAKAD